MDFLVVQFLSGLAAGSVLFLVASGLSIVFGVTRIVNFAHGSLTMLGAYLTYTLVETFGNAGGAGFWLALGTAALAIGVLGVGLEVLLLRRLYGSTELFSLLGTFGVVLVVQDMVPAVWGPADLLGPPAPGLAGSIAILGRPFPTYDLMLIALGPAVLGLLWLLFHRTAWGVAVRAATEDREMTAVLGVDQARLFTGVLFLGSTLAGLGGGLLVPRETITAGMDFAWIVDSFVVVVVGGMGSVPGAFLAALLVGQLQAFGILLFPGLTLVLMFLLMAVVLVLRPHGLLGATAAEAGRGGGGAPPAVRLGGTGRPTALILLGAGGVLALVPLAIDPYSLMLLTETLIFALYAASLHLLVGVGGLVSFGHAAYFGLGAYGAALLVHHGGWPMLPALLAAPVTAGLAAVGFGWFCVRRSGIYLAMLTLAFAQIAWSTVFHWYAVTGGDNGLIGLWPDRWAADPVVFYWLTLGLVTAGVAGLRLVAQSPFGYALAAGRDAPGRAETIGLAVRRQQWLALILAATGAGLAGGLYAFAKGSVFPSYLSIPLSVDGLIMVLMGGVHHLAGPLLGTAVFHTLQAELMSRTDLWRALTGVMVIALVLVFPHGLTGALNHCRGDRR